MLFETALLSPAASGGSFPVSHTFSCPSFLPTFSPSRELTPSAPDGLRLVGGGPHRPLDWLCWAVLLNSASPSAPPLPSWAGRPSLGSEQSFSWSEGLSFLRVQQEMPGPALYCSPAGRAMVQTAPSSFSVDRKVLKKCKRFQGNRGGRGPGRHFFL